MICDKKIALFHQDAKDRDEALKMLSDKFVEANVVEDTFLQGILKREAVFPTGLQLDVYGVAIPHTDPEYVKETQIGFMSLNNPVVFRDMGDLDNEIQVSVIFMMAIKEAHGQLEMLQKLMGMFGDNDAMEKLAKCSTYEEFIDIVKTAGLLD